MSVLTGERPVIFSAPMVRALLAGAKTQTRRPVKFQVGGGAQWVLGEPLVEGMNGHGELYWSSGGLRTWTACPYGAPGTRLWVRETWHRDQSGGVWGYYADYDPPHDGFGSNVGGGKVSPIFMPRWASRITLEVTGVRVERLQEISEPDAVAEGINTSVVVPSPRGCPDGIRPKNYVYARDVFADLWRSLHGADSWTINPYVWVVGFRRIP